MALSVIGWYFSSESKLLCLNASLYSGFAALNVSSLHDSLLMRLLIDVGSCRMMVGGWLDKRLMYSGLSLGFR